MAGSGVMIQWKTMISGGKGKTGRFLGIRATIALISMSFCLVVFPATGSTLIISAEKQLGLADGLFSRAEYADAISEYRRFSCFFPDHPEVDYAEFRIALSYFLNRNHEKALTHFETIAGLGIDSPYGIEARFMISRCCLALGRQEAAVAVLNNLISNVDDIDVRDRAYYQLGWIYLASDPLVDAGGIDRADAFFARISDKNSAFYKVGVLTERLRAVKEDEQGPLLSQKNPTMAGILAVFPGAGYVYCGRYHDALMSFLFNSAMAYAAYEAVDADLEALGSLIGITGLGFYAGSVYGSVSAAHKYNRANAMNFLNNLKEIRVEALPATGRDGIAVRFRVPF